MCNIIFMGRKPVAAKALEWLCKRDDVRIVAVITDNHLQVSPTRDVAQLYNLPILTRNQVESKLQSGEIEIDIGLSILYWQKIRQPLLTACRKGVINFHPAPLPDFKGTAGYNLAILNSMSEWAVSAHYVDASIDTGPLIDVSWFEINSETETALSLELKSQPVLFEQFIHIASKAINAKHLLPSKPNIGGQYISRDEMEAMKEIVSGDDISRKIRAFWFPPYDGAYMMVGGVKCTLVHAEILASLADLSTSSLFIKPNNEKTK